MQLRRSTGLVGHWKFNEKSGTVANDSSRYKNTGTLYGSPKWGEKGIIFDGVDDYVNAGNGVSLNIMNASSSLWIYPTAVTTGYPTIIVKGNTLHVVLQQNTNKPYIQIVYSVSGNQVTISSTALTLNQWNHIVTVVSDGLQKIYLNNVMVATTTWSGTITLNANNMIIGATYFNGSIDEVRIYNRALSAEEISELYEATKHRYI